MPDSLPERMWLRVTGEGQWTIADHEVNGSEQEAEYVRSDRCAELEVYPPRSGHWTGVEMMQLRYLLAAMTLRTLEEVSEPASELCHRLRYRRNCPSLDRETVASMMGEIYIEGLRMRGYKGPITGWNETWPTKDRQWIYEWIDGVLSSYEPEGMVVTSLEECEWEGEDGG